MVLLKGKFIKLNGGFSIAMFDCRRASCTFYWLWNTIFMISWDCQLDFKHESKWRKTMIHDDCKRYLKWLLCEISDFNCNMAIMAPVCGKGEITQFLIILELGSESIMQIHAGFLGKNILQHLFLERIETMGPWIISIQCWVVPHARQELGRARLSPSGQRNESRTGVVRWHRRVVQVNMREFTKNGDTDHQSASISNSIHCIHVCIYILFNI